MRALDIPSMWRGRGLPARATAAYEDMWERERPDLEELQRVWRRDVSAEVPIVVTLGSGLLHFLYECLAHLDRTRPIIVLASALTPEEEAWMAANVDVPWHAIRRDVDCFTVWEYLAATAAQGFVWVDVDCFVLDPTILDDLTRDLRADEIRGYWRYPGADATNGGGRPPLANTPLLAVGPDAIGLANERAATSFATYCHVLTRFGRLREDVYCRLVLPEHVDVVRGYVEVDGRTGAVRGAAAGIVDVYSDGSCHPATDREQVADAIGSGRVRRGFSYLETTVMLQLMLMAGGGTVRTLTSQDSYVVSSSVIHTGRVGYHRLGYVDRQSGAASALYEHPTRLPRPTVPAMVFDLPLISRFARMSGLAHYEALAAKLAELWAAHSSRLQEFGSSREGLERVLQRQLADAGVDREALALFRGTSEVVAGTGV